MNPFIYALKVSTSFIYSSIHGLCIVEKLCELKSKKVNGLVAH